jgi:hypothetical protein
LGQHHSMSKWGDFRSKFYSLENAIWFSCNFERYEKAIYELIGTLSLLFNGYVKFKLDVAAELAKLDFVENQPDAYAFQITPEWLFNSRKWKRETLRKGRLWDFQLWDYGVKERITFDLFVNLIAGVEGATPMEGNSQFKTTMKNCHITQLEYNRKASESYYHYRHGSGEILTRWRNWRY